jgi:hypothetical protein
VQQLTFGLCDWFELARVRSARRGVLRLHPIIPDERRRSPIGEPAGFVLTVWIAEPALRMGKLVFHECSLLYVHVLVT